MYIDIDIDIDIYVIININFNNHRQFMLGFINLSIMFCRVVSCSLTCFIFFMFCYKSFDYQSQLYHHNDTLEKFICNKNSFHQITTTIINI